MEMDLEMDFVCTFELEYGRMVQVDFSRIIANGELCLVECLADR